MYHSDKPIEKFEEDLLGRAPFAQQLAESILSIDLKDSFAIGIYGKWGTGKTSVLNMMQKELEKKALNEDGSQKAIIMRFEPWNFSTCDQLLTQFFTQMAAIVSSDKKNKSLQKVGTALERYSSGFELLELIPTVGPFLKIIPGLVKSVGKKMKEAAEADIKNLSSRKQAVVDALKAQSCRIVVTIDDIDRLSNEQIRLIFQLVSSVAGFPNVVYVLSFDKEIVARALQTVQMDNGLDYLEKVIQVPFELPEVEKEKIINVLNFRLNELLKLYPAIQLNNEYYSAVFYECIYPFISTLRDVNRVINALSLKLALVKDEVNFADLTAITVFQTMRPWIFEWIQKNKEILVGSTDFAEMISWNDDERKRSKDSFIREFSEKSEKEAETVFNALVTLFQKLGETYSFYPRASDDELRRDKRIAHVGKFDLYTTLSLEKISVSSSLLHSAINDYSEEDFSSLLMKLNNEDKVADFLMELKSRISQIPRERIPILVRSLLQNACSLKDNRDNPSIMLRQADNLAVLDAELLIAAFNEEADRVDLLRNLLLDCSADCLYSFADILNKIELSHGRLAANGKQQGKTIISIDELKQIETDFLHRITELFVSDEANMLNNPCSRMLCYLWSCLDKNSYVQKLDKLFDSPQNICRYVAMYTTNPLVIIGPKELTWRISNEYNEFISDEKISNTLDNMLMNRSFFNLDLDLQYKMAAYEVWKSSGKANDDLITQSAVQEQLKKWESKYQLRSQD